MTGTYTVSDLRRILHVNDPELRAYLRAALLPISTAKQPCSYSFQHLVVLRTAKGLSDAGVSVRRIRKILASLQRQLGEHQAMSSVKVYASGQRVVVWDGTSRWQPDSGQFLLNFEAHPPAVSTRLIPRRSARLSREESAAVWCGRGVALQDQCREAAQKAFITAIRLQPSLVEAHINLGRLYHEAGDFKQAEACYRRALRFYPQFALAHFNLGVVLEDQQHDEAAMEAYERAVQLSPRFQEAHCNLAELYERQGRPREALRHYAAAKRCGRRPGHEQK